MVDITIMNILTHYSQQQFYQGVVCMGFHMLKILLTSVVVVLLQLKNYSDSKQPRNICHCTIYVTIHIYIEKWSSLQDQIRKLSEPK